MSGFPGLSRDESKQGKERERPWRGIWQPPEVFERHFQEEIVHPSIYHRFLPVGCLVIAGSHTHFSMEIKVGHMGQTR